MGWHACRAAGLVSSSSTRTVRTPALRTVTSIVRKNRLGSRCRMRYLDSSASTTSRQVVRNVMPSVLYSMSGRRQRAYTFTVVVGISWTMDPDDDEDDDDDDDEDEDGVSDSEEKEEQRECENSGWDRSGDSEQHELSERSDTLSPPDLSRSRPRPGDRWTCFSMASASTGVAPRVTSSPKRISPLGA